MAVVNNLPIERRNVVSAVEGFAFIALRNDDLRWLLSSQLNLYGAIGLDCSQITTPLKGFGVHGRHDDTFRTDEPIFLSTFLITPIELILLHLLGIQLAAYHLIIISDGEARK